MIGFLLFPLHLFRMLGDLVRWAFADDGPRLFISPTVIDEAPAEQSPADSGCPGYGETIGGNSIHIEGSVGAWLREWRAGASEREAAAHAALADPAQAQQAAAELALCHWNNCQTKMTADQSDFQGPGPCGDIR